MGWIHRILRFFLLLILLAELAVLGAYFYITSERGLDLLAHKGSMLASSDGQVIAIDQLRGKLLRDITINKVTLADAKGVWLELHQLHVVWSPRLLLKQQPPLELVGIGQVVLLRQPEPVEDAANSKVESSSEIPSLKTIAGYLPRRIAVNDIWIQQPVTGMEQRLSVQGGGNAEKYQLQVQTLQGPLTSLKASVVPQQQDFTAQLFFSEAPGGIVGGLLSLPSDMVLSAQLDAQADVKGDIHIRNGQLQAGSFRTQLQGGYVLETGAMDVQATFVADDMLLVQALSGTPMSGSATGSATVKGDERALTFALAVNSPHMVVAGDRFNGSEISGSGFINLASLGKSDFTANGRMGAATTYNGVAVNADVEADVTSDTLTVKQWLASYGDMAAQGTLLAKGTPERFHLTSDTSIVTKFGPSKLSVNGDVDVPAQHYSGMAEGQFTYLKEAFDFTSTVDADANLATLKDLKLKGPGTDISGDVTVKIPEQLADGKLAIRATDLAPLGRLVQHPLAGALQADIALASRSSHQGVAVTIRANNLQAAGVSVAHADITARSEDVKKMQYLDATVAATGITASDVSVEQLNLQAKGALEKAITLRLNGKGTFQSKPWNLQFAGQASKAAGDASPLHVKFETLEGHFEAAPIRLAAPASLSYSASRSELSPFKLSLAQGTVEAKGSITPQTVAGGLTVQHLALDKLPMVTLPKANVDANVTLSGSAAAPALIWNAESKLVLEGMHVVVQTHGDWKQNTLQSLTTVQADKATAEATVKLPARLSLAPFATDLGEQTALTGSVKAELPLSLLNTQLRASGQRIEGLIAGNAKLLGTLSSPSFDGAFTLRDGRYDHNATGICLRNMSATLSGNQQAISLEEFKAMDSDKRLFKAHGKLALAGTPTLSGNASFDHFRLFCGGMLSGQLDGGVTLAGTTEAMSVVGNIVLGPLNVQIPGNRASTDIPNVETSWVKRGDTAKKEAKPSRIALDIKLSAPNQLFVRGRGLDAEFGGDLTITGTATTPEIDGALSKRRGKFVLLDRTMTLQTATIQFEGPIPPSPFLNIIADTTVNGNTITSTLSGSAAKPKIELTSTPSLPQDELLAQLLFGRQLSQITPFQALRLAQATRELAGLDDGGPGVLGTVRDTLGLDTLDVGTDTNNNVNVSTGKYISDKVYVGVNQGAKPEDRKVITEITLTPSISGKTSVDSVGNQGVGLEWKKDY